MTVKKLLRIDEASLPNNWKGVTLADVTEYIQRGKGPKYIEHSKLPVINQKCIRWFGIQKEHLKYVDPEQWSSWGEERYVRVGDVLWNSTGTGTIGRAALVRNLAPGEKYVVDSHVTIVRPRDIDPQYVHYWIMSPSVQGSIEAMQSGSTNQVELSKSAVEALPIPVAPPDQQKSIVAEIEKQFSRLDEAVANLKRVKANLKRYKAAVLKAAVEGKLTEDWRKQHPDVEPANKLLERILAERRKKWNGRGKYAEPSASETTDLASLPKGWKWATVEQLSTVVRGASPRPAGDPRYFGGSIPWITVGPITADKNPYLTAVPETVTKEGKERSRYIEPDTLLLTNSGATLGVPKITLIGGCINDGVAALLDVGHPLKLYLLYFLHTRTAYLRGVNQGAAQPNLNTSIIKAINVPLPPHQEQEQIVAEIERRLSVVEELEAAVEANLTRADRLRQSILKRAFEGKLIAAKQLQQSNLLGELPLAAESSSSYGVTR